MPVVCKPTLPGGAFLGIMNAILIEGVVVLVGWAIWTYIL